MKLLLSAAGLAVLLLLVTASVRAETGPAAKPLGLTEAEAKLKELFPTGHRPGREGVMTLGGKFRTVVVRNWEGCRELCFKNPAEPGGGCWMWSFVKAADAKMPNVCRMWWVVPDLKDNPDAVSGAGRMK